MTDRQTDGQIWAENWGLCPFWEGELDPHDPIYHKVARDEAYLHAKFDLDLSNRLATIHQR